MNEQQIEKLLQKTPLLKTPEGLYGKLKADIRVPRMETGRSQWTPSSPSWFRCWMPALSFAAIFLVCLVAIGVQTNTLTELRKENDALKAGSANSVSSLASNAEYQKLLAENQELDRLRKDNAELLKLRGEVAQLQSQLGELEKLRAENQQLQTAASQAGAAANTSGDFFADAQARAERIMCVNNLKQIGLAARIWSDDHKGIYPPDFITMTNEMVSWQILQCPGDKTHKVRSWADVAAGNISYVMDSPGMNINQPNVVFVECPIHHNICLVDGSVQQMSEEAMRTRIKVVDGRKELQ